MEDEDEAFVNAQGRAARAREKAPDFAALLAATKSSADDGALQSKLQEKLSLLSAYVETGAELPPGFTISE